MDPSTPLRRGVVGELFWKMSEPILILDQEGRVEALNPVAASLLTAPEEGDLTIEDVAIALDLPPSGLRMATSSLQESLIEGPEKCYSVISFAVSDRIAVVLRDVTEQREHVRRLRALNRIAREVLTESSVEVVLQNIVDAAKEITGASFSALLMLKKGSDIDVSKFVYNAPRDLFPDRLPRAVGLLAVAIRSKTAARLDDIRDHPLGIGIPVKHPPIKALLAVPIVADGEVLGELAVANGPEGPSFTESEEALLTELGLHAVQALRYAETRERASADDESQQAMLDMLRHDMMTPISTAKGALDLLIGRPERLSDEQRDRLFQALVRAVENVERLASNLRSDAHLESPRLTKDFARIEVAELLQELVGDLGGAAGARNVTVSTQSESDLPASFTGARLLVRQALENLLTNAIKFSPEGGEVVLTARLEGASIRFDVRDDGPGIPLEQQSRLFGRFAMEADSGVERQGLGLGLSIVRRVAEAHSGNVGVASRPGQGANFWVSFPIDPARE